MRICATRHVFPIISSIIFAVPRQKMQTASFHITDDLHVTPARPAAKIVDGERHVTWNPGSAIRLVAHDAKRADLSQVNSKMERIVVAIVTSCKGHAKEEMAVLPAIVLTEHVDKGTEIVCLIDDSIYSKAPQKEKKRFAVVQGIRRCLELLHLNHTRLNRTQ